MKAAINFLSEDEKNVIHRGTLEVLEKVGIGIGSNLARQLLFSRGAKIEGENVRFPKQMVAETLELVNKQITLAARAEKNTITLPAQDQPFVTTAGYVPFVTDEGCPKPRLATSDDLRKFSILSDAFDEFGFFWPIVIPGDVPLKFQEIKAVEISLLNTTKHIQASVSSGEIAKWMIELAAVLAGGKDKLKRKPLISLLGAPNSPLYIEHGISESIVVSAQAGIPIVPMSLPQLGTTSPATVAANTIMANAEVIGCYMLAKAAADDAPVIYAADTGAPNLQSMAFDYNNPEYLLLAYANADMARYYQMPSMVAGGMAENKDFSSVEGFERNVFKYVLALMSRTDLSCSFGSVDNCLSSSFIEVILDVEAYKYARHYLRGFSADTYKLAVDVITEVGPRGNFLAHQHTFDNFKQEIFTGHLKDSFIFSEPTDKNYRQLASEKADQIIANHQVTQIDPAIVKEMEIISKKAYQALVG